MKIDSKDPRVEGVREVYGKIWKELNEMYTPDRGYPVKITECGVYIPSGIDALTGVFNHIDLCEDDSFIDLGSGDGVVCNLAGLWGARSEGFELDKELFFYSVAAKIMLRNGQEPNVRFVNANYAGYPIDEFNVAYFFPNGEINGNVSRTLEKIRDEMRPGSKVIIQDSHNLGLGKTEMLDHKGRFYTVYTL